ncbi:repressor of RNA polymerase III transcription [Haematococcus lacustris]|uniref:Repressor of RNA polymerase III transcription n=1 Tax=Haematococcus lacustris TaxID=44745 RepID=A0A699Z3N7_HAELA|nr:repressor of RNA polymerase III transcription [Haematococcus lacustris]
MAVPFRFFLAIAQRALRRAVAFSSNLGFPEDSWSELWWQFMVLHAAAGNCTKRCGRKLKRILYFSCRAKSKTCAEEVTESSSKYVYNTDSEEEVNYGMAVGMDA